MQTTISIQKAGKGDFDKICQLLAEENLPTADISLLLENFYIAVENGGITGVIGMDRYDGAGLLRSVIVKAGHRNTGIATALVHHLLDDARQQGVASLYLITSTAEKYFKKRGFERIGRNEVPENVLQSREFNGLCPASAVVMFRKL